MILSNFFPQETVRTPLNLETPILYNDREPYHYLTANENEPIGLVADSFRVIAKKLDLNIRYLKLPVNRIFHEVKKNKNVCSFGWFKNDEREVFALFSKPLLLGSRIQLITSVKTTKIFEKEISFKDFFAKTNLVFGKRVNQSFGKYLDQIIRSSQSKVRTFTTNEVSILKMLNAGRFDMTLVVSEEIQTVLKKAKLSSELFRIHNLKDLPLSDSRRLMCSKGVDQKIFNRIQSMISDN